MLACTIGRPVTVHGEQRFADVVRSIVSNVVPHGVTREKAELVNAVPRPGHECRSPCDIGGNLLDPARLKKCSYRSGLGIV